MMIKLEELKKQRILIIFFTHGHRLCSQRIKEKINFELLNLGSTIKANIIWIFLSSYLIKEKKIKINYPNDFLLNVFWKSSQSSNQTNHHQSKHLIKGDGSYFYKISSSWIWLHSNHRSTTSDPWTSL
jgi:hypothetical protein